MNNKNNNNNNNENTIQREIFSKTLIVTNNIQQQLINHDKCEFSFGQNQNKKQVKV